MLIRVKYIDNSFDMVRPEVLDHLLEMGTVSEFHRQNGWVASSSDSVRKNSRSSFQGPDRREKRSINYHP